MSDNPAKSSIESDWREQVALARVHRDAYAKDLAEARREVIEWQARHQSLVSLWEQLQASYDQLQSDYRRLSTTHLEILLAHGSLLREHRALTAPLQPPTPAPAQGDSGIEFGPDFICGRVGCPTTPPHRHITPPPPLNDQAGVDHPSPATIRSGQGISTKSSISDQPPSPINVEYPPDLSTIISSQEPTLEETIQQRRARIQATLDDQASGAENDGFLTKANPNKEPMDVNNIVGGPNEAELAAARRAYQDEFEQKTVDIYNQAFGMEVDERYAGRYSSEEVLNDAAEQGIAAGIEASKAGTSDETRNSPEKSTEER